MINIIRQIASFNSIGFNEEVEDGLKEKINTFAPFIILGLGLLCLSQCLLERGTPLERKLAKKKFFKKDFPGESAIYLSAEKPNILIKCGCWVPSDRLRHMNGWREYCHQREFQHLIIPNAYQEEEYLVEEYLPIRDCTTQGQIGLYSENRELFSGAAEEFTILLCENEVSDLLGGKHFLGHFSQLPIVRYDNVPLFIQDGVGKIGLIDLENFNRVRYNESYVEECLTAIQLFPYHFDLIIKTAAKYDPCIKDHMPLFEERRAEALNFLDTVYFSYKRFLEKNGVTLDNPLKSIKISNSIKEKIVEQLILKLEEPRKKVYYDDVEAIAKKFFFDSADHLELLRTVLFPSIINKVDQFNQKRLSFVNEKANTMAKVMVLRGVMLDRYCNMSQVSHWLDSPLNQIVMKEIAKHKIIEDEKRIKLFSEWTCDLIYEQLAEKKVIAGFRNRCYGGCDAILF